MSYASEVLADSPVAYYRMQEASGLIQDSSGNAMHANTSSGTPVYEQASPITSDGTAKSILYSAANFQVPDNNTIDVGDTFTVEVWYKKTNASELTNSAWIDRGTAAFKVHISGTTDEPPGNQVILAKPGTGNSLVSSVSVADTNWHYIVVTKSGATNKVYVDAVEDTSATVTNQTCTSTATALFVGSSRNSDDYAKGLVCELALYPTALSQARISAHYAAATFAGQTLLPDADTASGNWAAFGTASLWQATSDDSDSTYMFGTAS